MKQLDLFEGVPVKEKNSDIIGQRFGKLVVIRSAGLHVVNKKTGQRKTLYECKCDCGNTTVKNLSLLKIGHTTSCGCLQDDFRKNRAGKHRFNDLTGQVFGKLTVVGVSGKDSHGEHLWRCRCECGGEKITRGRYLLKGNTHFNCGCGKPAPPPKPIKKKPIDREQYAKDLYCCYIVDQKMTIRAASDIEGYTQSATLINMFLDFVPGYKEASEKRRADSEYNQRERGRKKKSEQFKFEKDFQDCCVKKLKWRNLVVKENVNDVTGLEIDIMTDTCCYELKVTSRHKDTLTALGQLIANRTLSNLRPVLLIPSDVVMHSTIEKVFKENGIEIKTEKDL